MKSMTGYGSCFLTTDEGNYLVEINSQNRKHLETSVFLPEEFSNLEIDVKKNISTKITRGYVKLKFNFSPSENSLNKFLPDIQLLKSLKKKWETIAQTLKLEKKIDLYFLIKQSENFPIKHELNQHIKISFLKCVNNALDKLLAMKEKEGAFLEKDIKKRLKIISSFLPKIKKLVPNSSKKYEEKLKEKLKKFLEPDERILKEIAIFAEKIDVTEELTRLESHIKQFSSLLTKISPIGKKMDFILQEMLREANTIASKSMDKNIISYIIEIKSELEKIREQTQNIE